MSVDPSKEPRVPADWVVSVFAYWAADMSFSPAVWGLEIKRILKRTIISPKIVCEYAKDAIISF